MPRALLAVLAGAMAVVALAAQVQNVPYPTGYRDWRHVKSMVIAQGHPLFDAFGGIHHIYANDMALKGYASGKFPDGAIIVFDLLEAHTKDNATTEGARKVLGVMHKDSKRWSTTGGWGFEGFKGDSRTDRGSRRGSREGVLRVPYGTEGQGLRVQQPAVGARLRKACTLLVGRLSTVSRR